MNKHEWGATLDVCPAVHSCTCGFYGTREDVNRHIEALPPFTTCPECGVENAITWHRADETFTYGVGPNAVELPYTVDRAACAVCKFEFTDWRAEDARYEAVKKHLKVP